MTNLLLFAEVTITLTTNWTPVGTWNPVTGPSVTVEQGTLQTNAWAFSPWSSALTAPALVGTCSGPVIGKRRITNAPPVMTNSIQWYQWSHTNWAVPPMLYITNR